MCDILVLAHRRDIFPGIFCIEGTAITPFTILHEESQLLHIFGTCWIKQSTRVETSQPSVSGSICGWILDHVYSAACTASTTCSAVGSAFFAFARALIASTLGLAFAVLATFTLTVPLFASFILSSRQSARVA